MENKPKSILTIHRERREVVSTRVFDAPRELVYQVYTDPKLIPQWWGPRRYTTTIDKMDLRPGGVWRYVQRGEQGDEYGFHGVYREITPPERLTYTFEYEGMPGHELVETVVFEDLGSKTRVTTTSVYQTLEDLEGMVQSGMEEGTVESYERIDELLQTVKP